MHTLPYKDRSDAGRTLAHAAQHYADRDDLLILALPRGGVPVAYELAQHLHAPLDVLTVRKLGVPGHEELAMGAVATGGTVILNQSLINELGITSDMIDHAVQ